MSAGIMTTRHTLLVQCLCGGLTAIHLQTVERFVWKHIWDAPCSGMTKDGPCLYEFKVAELKRRIDRGEEVWEVTEHDVQLQTVSKRLKPTEAE